MTGLRKGDKISRESHAATSHGKAVEKQTEPIAIKDHKVSISKDNPEFIGETVEGKRAAHEEKALAKA